MQNIIAHDEQELEVAFQILEITEATALQEMGASHSILASSTCCQENPG